MNARVQALVSAQGKLDSTRLGREVGVRTIIDLLNAEQAYYQARRDVAKARYDYLIARLQLAYQTGSLTPERLAQENALLEH